MLQLSDYLLETPQNLAAYLQEHAGNWLGVPGERQLPPFLFCGELSVASREALHTHMQERSLFVPAITSSRHASTLALQALQQLRESNGDDPLLLEPLYIRRPSITTSVRKQPLLGGLSHRPGDYGSPPIHRGETEREEGALRH
jgi:tRNA threonylcarbamoyladenosine biosynthesis protein TsaB